MKRSVFWIILLVFLLPLGSASGELPAAASQNPAPAEIFPQPLAPRKLTPPENCGVPLNGPFGKDLEVYRGGEEGVRYDYTPAWENYQIQPGNQARTGRAVAAAALNSGQMVAVWEDMTLPQPMYDYAIWGGSWPAARQQLPALSHKPDGNPVVIASGGHTWEVYVRVGDQIQHITWDKGTISSWEPVPGLTAETSAASDPAVITSGPQHILVFYRDINGKVRFTERQGGVWRNKPVVLSEMSGMENSLYLPLVARGMASGSALWQAVTENNTASAAPASTASPSELSAASRNDNHAAVFYVDGQNRLWVNEWTNLNNSDWSDTHWQLLMENVMIEKPAVASRHINHLAVAVPDTSGTAYTIEWSPEAGWKEPYSLGKISAGPLAMASTSIDSLSVFGKTPNPVNAWRMTWQADNSWVESPIPLTSLDYMTPVVMHSDDLMLLHGFINGYVTSTHFTSQGVTPTEIGVVPQYMTKGYPRGQTLAWVGGKTLLVTAHEDIGGAGSWQVDAKALGGVGMPATLPLTNHPYAADSLVYAAAADLDFDGDDEVVVATEYPPTGSNTIISLSVLKFGINPDQSLSVSALKNVQIETSLKAVVSFSLALDDLDADGKKNELALAFKSRNDWSDIQLIVYQYDKLTQALVKKAELKVLLSINYYMENYAGAQVEVDTGRFYSGLAGQQIVLSNLDVYWYSGFFWKFPTMRTYRVDTTSSANWTIIQVNQDNVKNEQITQKWWWDLVKGDGDATVPGIPGVQILGYYSSALDTGDLDADGYDEIALGYSNQVLIVDPRGATAAEIVKLVPFDSSLLYSIAPERSLAVGDIDRDGREEILSEMYIKYFPDFTPKFNLFEMFGDGTLKQTSTFTLPAANAGGRLNAILIGDIDHDSFISRLTGCGTFSEVKIVAVLNGAPRWYAGGKPINESRGTYSVSRDGTISAVTGTRFNLGASFTVGFAQEFNIPLTGIEAGEVRASVTRDFMLSQGIQHTREDYESWGTGLGFEGESLGEVVYQSVSYHCNFYDIYAPGAPQDTSKAMACIPGEQSTEETQATSLDRWREPEGQQEAGLSWADVGHRAPDGSYSNDLAIAGNYRPSLPVDEYMLVYEGAPVTVKYAPGQGVEWWFETGTGGARTLFTDMELNTTVSAGATAFGATFDVSSTSGIGFENSQTISWGEKLAFYGKINQFQDRARLCYTVVPFVYQAKALTRAGVTYPYWEMDYYVTDIRPCVLAPNPNP